MDLKYYPIIIILYAMVVRGADDQFCSASSSRVDYGGRCNVSARCTTGYCNNDRCLCPPNTYYHNCKAACVLSCNVTSQDANGTIVSHDYPLQYPDQFYCKWTLSGVPNTYFLFSISDMDLEENSRCSYDSLAVYSGVNESTQIALLCKRNATRQYTIASLSNVMEIVFKTDVSVALRGFSGSYQRFDNNMIVRDSVFGYIASPGYPRTYPTSSYFSWNIEGKNGTFVTLRFMNFSLGDSSLTCADDFVQIFDGSNDTSRSLAKMCGTTFEPIVMSTKPSLRVVLRTSNAKNSSGFEASYQIDDCRTTLTEPSGYIVSPGYPYQYSPLLNCTWAIIADTDQLIFFRILNIELYEADAFCYYDHLKIHDGPNTEADLLGTYCTYPPTPPVIVSTSNALHLHFQTDGTNHRKGFRGSFLTIARPLAQPCDNTTQCNQRPVCQYGLCVCPDNFYYSYTTYTCNEALGDTIHCNPSVRNMCKKPDFECRLDNLNVTRCLCVPGMYSTWTQCAPNSELSVRLSSHPQITTNDTLFTWTTGSPRYPTTYKITWSATEDSGDMGEMPASNNGVHVYRLTPGQEYVFTVVTTLGANSFYNKTTVYTNFTVVTIPAPPGEIIDSISSLTSSPHVLRFQPSEGRVAGYRVTLGDTLYEVLIPEVTVTNLSADTHYNYTITAYNKRGDTSHVVSGCFKTGPADTFSDFPIGQPDETTKVPLIAGVTTGSIVVMAGAIVVIVIIVRKRNPNRYNQTRHKTVLLISPTSLMQSEMSFEDYRASRTDGNVTKTCNDEISVTGTSTKSTHPGGRTMNEYRTMNTEDLSMAGRTTDNTHLGGRTMNIDDIRTGDNQAESDYDCIRESVMASWKEGTYVNTKEIENAHRSDQDQEDDVYENVGFDQK